MNEIKDLKIVVLVSGNGSNLQALIDASKLKDYCLLYTSDAADE